MPTPYDSFSPEAASDFTNLPRRIIRNRDLLQSDCLRYAAMPWAEQPRVCGKWATWIGPSGYFFARNCCANH